MQADLAAVLERGEQVRQGQFFVGESAVIYARVAGLKQNLQQLDKELDVLRGNVQKALEVWQEKRKKRMSADRLVARRVEEENEDRRRHEQRSLDESTLLRRLVRGWRNG